MNLSSKMIESFGSFSEQLLSLLTNKQLDKAEVLCETALSKLKQGVQGDAKSQLTKFVVSFLKLFACCPANFYEGLVKKYFSILRELHFLKSKHNIKYECLLPAFLETAESKYYASFESFMKANKLKPLSNIKTHILSLTFIEEGISLRDFLQLFKKAIEKDRQNTQKCDQYLASFINVMLYTVNSMFDDWTNKKQQFPLLLYTFRLLVLSQLELELRSKCENSLQREISKMTEHFLSSKESDTKIEAQTLFLFVEVVSHGVLCIAKEREAKNKENMRSDLKSYFLDSVTALSIITNPLLADNLNVECWKYLFLLKKRTFFNNFHNHHIRDTKDIIVVELIENFNFHSKNMKNKRMGPLQLGNMVLSFPAQLQESLQLFQNPSSLFKNKLIQKISLSNVDSPKSGLYLTILYWKLATFHIQDHLVLAALEEMLCQQLKNQIQTIEISRQQIEKLYFSLSLNITYQRYIDSIFPNSKIKHQSKTPLIWTTLFERINGCERDQQSEYEMREEIDKLIQNLNHLEFDFQDLLDFIEKLFSASKEKCQNGVEKEQGNLTTFCKLSLVLINKLGIRPVEKDKISSQLTFQSKSCGLFVRTAQYLIIKLYEKDHLLKTNFFFMKSIPTNDSVPAEKMIVFALKKYISIAYNKLNEMFMRRLIANREFLIIWCMLMCNYKVRTLFQQMNRCGIVANQLQSFLGIDRNIIKQFTEYSVNKDRFKFRLILWQKSLTNQTYLLDSYIPDLLIATYFKDEDLNVA